MAKGRPKLSSRQKLVNKLARLSKEMAEINEILSKQDMEQLIADIAAQPTKIIVNAEGITIYNQ